MRTKVVSWESAAVTELFGVLHVPQLYSLLEKKSGLEGGSGESRHGDDVENSSSGKGVRNLIFCSGKGGGVASRSRWRGDSPLLGRRVDDGCDGHAARPRRREEDVGAVLDGASLVPERRSLS